MSARRDDEFTDYVAARLPWLRRAAYLLCQDTHRTDDLVQAAITKLYVYWGRARALEHTDAYLRTILVREFLRDRRTGWARFVTVGPDQADEVGAAEDWDAPIDMEAALARLPRRQRATLVLRFYWDLTVGQAAELMGCTPGTVKSQTAKALAALRGAPEFGPAAAAGRWPVAVSGGRREVGNHG